MVMKKFNKKAKEYGSYAMTTGISTAMVAGMPGGGAFTGGFSTMASFGGIAATGSFGLTTLKMFNKKSKKY